MTEHKQVVVDECVSVVNEGYNTINSLENYSYIFNDIKTSIKYTYLRNKYDISKRNTLPEEELVRIMVSFLKEKGNSVMIPSFLTGSSDINDYEGISRNIIERFRYYITRLLESKNADLESILYLENEYRYPGIISNENRQDILKKIKNKKEQADQQVFTVNYLNKIFPKEFYYYQDFLENRKHLVEYIENEGVRILDLNRLDNYSSYLDEQIKENIQEASYAASYLKKHYDDNDVFISREILDKSSKILGLANSKEDVDTDMKEQSMVI